MKVLTFSSRPQTACFHVVNKKRTAVINRKLPKYADESSCHASHTMNFAVVFPQHSCSVKVPTVSSRFDVGSSNRDRLSGVMLFLVVE